MTFNHTDDCNIKAGGKCDCGEWSKNLPARRQHIHIDASQLDQANLILKEAMRRSGHPLANDQRALFPVDAMIEDLKTCFEPHGAQMTETPWPDLPPRRVHEMTDDEWRRHEQNGARVVSYEPPLSRKPRFTWRSVAFIVLAPVVAVALMGIFFLVTSAEWVQL
jgi:hypothetical protein